MSTKLRSAERHQLKAYIMSHWGYGTADLADYNADDLRHIIIASGHGNKF